MLLYGHRCSRCHGARSPAGSADVTLSVLPHGVSANQKKAELCRRRLAVSLLSQSVAPQQPGPHKLKTSPSGFWNKDVLGLYIRCQKELITGVSEHVVQ